MIPEDKREQMARQFIDALPFCKALDMRIEETARARAVMSMPHSPDIVGDPETGVIHGGAVSALLDTCGGLAVSLHPEGVKPTATIDLRIDYMRPAEAGARIFAEAEVHNATRSVAFVRAIAHDGDATRPVAAATGAFTFAKAKGAKT